MNNFPTDDAPSQLRVTATLLIAVLLAAFNTILLDALRTAIPERLQTGWNGSTDLLINGVFLIEALLLCLGAFRASGLKLGDARHWKRFRYAVMLVWIMPPLLVLSLYTTLTEQPFHTHHWPIGWWLVGSIAQELLFAGFIYGQMSAVFGAPKEGTGGAFSAPVLVTAFLYSLYHWPNLTTTEHGMTNMYPQLQLVYSFIGCAWMLNIRRWTDSIWPLILNHVLVNLLATLI